MNKEVIDPIPVNNISDEMANETKRFFKSKTLWVNVIAFICFLIQSKVGFVISEELQMQLLTLINIILRFVTKESIVWK